jgi:hypothetical protein
MNVITLADSITTKFKDPTHMKIWQLNGKAHDFAHDFTTAGCGRDRMLRLSGSLDALDKLINGGGDEDDDENDWGGRRRFCNKVSTIRRNN